LQSLDGAGLVPALFLFFSDLAWMDGRTTCYLLDDLALERGRTLVDPEGSSARS